MLKTLGFPVISPHLGKHQQTYFSSLRQSYLHSCFPKGVPSAPSTDAHVTAGRGHGDGSLCSHSVCSCHAFLGVGLSWDAEHWFTNPLTLQTVLRVCNRSGKTWLIIAKTPRHSVILECWRQCLLPVEIWKWWASALLIWTPLRRSLVCSGLSLCPLDCIHGICPVFASRVFSLPCICTVSQNAGLLPFYWEEQFQDTFYFQYKYSQ